jgi:LSD1 subclass zinc finger protein
MQVPADLLRCPGCRHAFLVAHGAAEVRCTGCAGTYPVGRGVVDLLPGLFSARTLAQAAMEFEPIIRIYESQLWRRSLVATLAFGIGFDQELALIVQAADVRGEASVLDLACGPGIYTRPFAHLARAGLVVGLDLSLPMLRTAARLAEDEHLGNVLFVHGNALDLPFAPERFDAVNCCGALHLFPNVTRALAEVHRVLRPRGRFTVAAFRRPEGIVSSAVNAVRARLAGIDAFTERDLRTRLHRGGFVEAAHHHAGRGWQIMSARRA